MSRAVTQSASFRRRGATTAGVLTTLMLVGGGVAAAVVLTPRFITAAPVEVEPPQPASSPTHQAVIDLFGAVIAGSHEVLAIHGPGATPFTEIVLWLKDRENLGTPDASEIAVISHSAIMQTIVLHALDPESDSVSIPLARSDIASAGFCAAWRDRADVTRRVLAHGVERVVLEELAVSRKNGPMLRISFSWAPDSADGPDQASVLLDVAMGG